MPRSRPSFLLGPCTALLFALAVAGGSAAESHSITGPNGQKVELEVHEPPAFDPEREYSVLVGPGDYYWQGEPSQPGWITVTSHAFFEGRGDETAVLDWLRKTYKVRQGGFHITGWSANSAAIFKVAMDHPEQFLSVTGVAGMPGRGSEDRLERLRGVRVQFIVGERDTYWREGSERWHRLLEEKGVQSSLEIVPDGEHVMPEIADGPFFERLNRLVAAIEAQRD
ncbi:MAG: hypothetical protein AAF604_15260 [Acidobacteriota bacterium]